MTDPEVIYPGSRMWPEGAPTWAEHATTFRPAGNPALIDLMFTRRWMTVPPHHPDDADPEPFIHFVVKKGWTRVDDGPWDTSAWPELTFGGPDAPMGTPQEIAAMLREVANVLDGSAD